MWIEVPANKIKQLSKKIPSELTYQTLKITANDNFEKKTVRRKIGENLYIYKGFFPLSGNRINATSNYESAKWNKWMNKTNKKFKEITDEEFIMLNTTKFAKEETGGK